jgi:hypothetical protein
MMKQNSPNCPHCPKEIFPAKSIYAKHMMDNHGIGVEDIHCINCGISKDKIDDLARHQIRCFPVLSENSPNKCEYCYAIFFFDNVHINPFYISHMNIEHMAQVMSKWNNPCSYCHFHIPPMPDQMEDHLASCLNNITINGGDNAYATASKKRLRSEAQELELEALARQPRPIQPNPNRGESLRCGLCANVVYGGREKLYDHTTTCYLKKVNSITCPRCPSEFYETKGAFSKHLDVRHRPSSYNTRCVICGRNCPTWYDLIKHQSLCFPKLSTKAFNPCEYCDTAFFFADIRNVFFFGHVNNEHSDKIRQKWVDECANCKFRFPNETFLRKHMDSCIESVNTTPGLPLPLFMPNDGLEHEEEESFEATSDHLQCQEEYHPETIITTEDVKIEPMEIITADLDQHVDPSSIADPLILGN